LFFLDSPYLIQVKDIDGKNHLSGIMNTPCVVQSKKKSFFFCIKNYFSKILVHTKSTSNCQIRAVVLLGTVQIPSTMKIINENLIRINFTPQEPGFYFVNIYSDNQSIEGILINE